MMFQLSLVSLSILLVLIFSLLLTSLARASVVAASPTAFTSFLLLMFLRLLAPLLFLSSLLLLAPAVVGVSSDLLLLTVVQKIKRCRLTDYDYRTGNFVCYWIIRLSIIGSLTWENYRTIDRRTKEFFYRTIGLSEPGFRFLPRLALRNTHSTNTV
jgi:hypothetical protein